MDLDEFKQENKNIKEQKKKIFKINFLILLLFTLLAGYLDIIDIFKNLSSLTISVLFCAVAPSVIIVSFCSKKTIKKIEDDYNKKIILNNKLILETEEIKKEKIEKSILLGKLEDEPTVFCSYSYKSVDFHEIEVDTINKKNEYITRKGIFIVFDNKNNVKEFLFRKSNSEVVLNKKINKIKLNNQKIDRVYDMYSEELTEIPVLKSYIEHNIYSENLIEISVMDDKIYVFINKLNVKFNYSICTDEQLKQTIQLLNNNLNTVKNVIDNLTSI